MIFSNATQAGACPAPQALERVANAHNRNRESYEQTSDLDTASEVKLRADRVLQEQLLSKRAREMQATIGAMTCRECGDSKRTVFQRVTNSGYAASCGNARDIASTTADGSAKIVLREAGLA